MNENNKGIFDPYRANVKDRRIKDLKELKNKVEALREHFGCKIVLTQGSFDIAHIGHYRYLEASRKLGDFLIVGVDSDAKIRQRKGPSRPVVDQEERMEILCHTRYVDMVILKEINWKHWELIKTVRPDILIATDETYTSTEVKELQSKYCGRVVVLPPQATTSTTAKIRKILVGKMEQFKKDVAQRISEVLENVMSEAIQSVEKKPKK